MSYSNLFAAITEPWRHMFWPRDAPAVYDAGHFHDKTTEGDDLVSVARSDTDHGTRRHAVAAILCGLEKRRRQRVLPLVQYAKATTTVPRRLLVFRVSTA